MKTIILYLVLVSFVFSCKGGKATTSTHQDVLACSTCLDGYFTPSYYEKLKDLEQYFIETKLVDEINYSQMNRFVRVLKENPKEKERVGLILKKYEKEPVGLSEFYALKFCCERIDSTHTFSKNVLKFYDSELSDSSIITFLNTIGQDRFNEEDKYKGVFLFILEWHLRFSYTVVEKNRKKEKRKE